MKVHAQLKSAVLSFHRMLASVLLPVTSERGALLCFLFHSLFEREEELWGGALDPQQGITVDMFRAFVSHFHEQGYGFVSPGQILEGLQPGGKYVLLTFDDGYFNNLRALPAMEEFDAPAVFFISSDHVREGKTFWWDVVFREGRKHRKTPEEIRRIVASYKRLKTEQVEFDLNEEFGKDALRPVGDLDRPFTPGELREFAGHRLVSLGNHTKNHAILTNYGPAEAREQIQGGQEAIEQMTGKLPEIISYPNGNSTAGIQQLARKIGLPLGMIARGGKNRLPLKFGAPEAMILKRFMLWGDCGIDAQCRATRSSVSIERIQDALSRLIRSGRPSERLCLR
jgi:peptidoglycan/xylan/chitin deacetylase (PgdA/CDA1 family)